MDNVKMVPSRNGFGEALKDMGRLHPDVVVIGADTSDSVRLSYFAEKFPDRFFQVGIAEQNAIGVAAGLSLAGKIPVFSTYAVFAAGRAWEQIRTTVCYSKLKVVIGGAHSGISVGPDGATHEALEDIAIMRVLPNMTVLTPADAEETRKATVKAIEEIKGPVYIRFGRAPVPLFTTPDDPFEIGKGRLLRDGGDVAIIACGAMVYESLVAADILAREGIEASVVNMSTIKPIDRNIIVESAMRCGLVVSVEEHQIFGGLGGAVSEVLSEHYPVPMEIIGIEDRFGESGKPDELMDYFGLTGVHIARRVAEFVNENRKAG